MRVCLLSPYSTDVLSPIYKACWDAGDAISAAKWEGEEPDITIMWGWRKILKPEEIAGRRIINIHIAWLPFNRGAHPNLWSWYDGTPKGVSIHEVTEKVDAGPLLARRHVNMDENRDTLRSSYDKLQVAALELFGRVWCDIRCTKIVPFVQEGGSYHNTVQSMDLMRHFPLGFDTPVKDIAEFGRMQRKEML